MRGLAWQGAGTGRASPPARHRPSIAGALGYISKRASASSLLTAIRAVHEGRCFVDPSLVGSLLQDFLPKRASQSGTPVNGSGLLSRRECEVLILLAQGYTNRQIADQIRLSIKTVESYRARIVDKLELRSRAELIRYAHESGILTPDTVF